MSKEKTRYNHSELAEFRKIIDSKIEKATSELKFYQDQVSTLSSNNENKFRGIDDGTGTTEKAHLTQMVARQSKFLKHLRDALIRIENHTYGICRETGKLISADRLKAVPHATLSIEAKNEQK